MAEAACAKAGASAALTQSLLAATLSAERSGRGEVGIAHLPDYLNALGTGGIRGDAEPVLESPFPAFIASDARGGIAQLGFDRAFEDLVGRAQTYGIAVFSQRDSFPAGELGYYARRLAEAGCIALAAGNAHAMMATAPGGKAVFSTNPLAFGAPLPAPRPPLVIDQASSATAYVNLLRAAKQETPIPEGWATDAEGRVTTSAASAILGALLPFGGYKGANVALMVEVLAAGLSEAAWSLDVPHFQTGGRAPGSGLTVIALALRDEAAFAARLERQCLRLVDAGVRIPGSGARRGPFDENETIEIGDDIREALR